MKKISFFFLIFTLFLSPLKADSNLVNQNLLHGCSKKIDKDYLINYEKIKINKIEVDTLNYRNWTVNSIKIITTGKRYIEDIYKKRFEAKITVHYDDGIKCFFKARIRHSGDQKDHITLNNNNIIQSIDVHLDSGHIRGITKFKLLLPNTRGVLEDVLIQNQLLRNFNYLAPRSIKLNARINEANSVMLFQEKASKELLEHNRRREGLILEANEMYFWKALKDVPDDQLSNWEAGVVPILNKSSKHMLAKITNSNLIMKNAKYKQISFDALSKLNTIFLYYANRFQDKKNKYNHWEYDLDNSLLGQFNKENIQKLNIYNLLLQATNSNHGLSVNNRKFYWNAFDNYFEPIHYDANPNIESDISKNKVRFPLNDSFMDSFEILEFKIKKINLDDFTNDLNSNGLEINKNIVKLKFKKILDNLNKVKKNYKNFYKKEDDTYNRFKNINNISNIFFKIRNELDPNSFIIKHKNNNDLIKCKISSQKCDDIMLSNKDLADLLEGRLKMNQSVYEYLGKNIKFKNFGALKNFKKTQFNDTEIFFEDGILVSINKETNVINITQNKAGSKIFLKNGELKDSKIIFNGYYLNNKTNDSKLKKFPPNFPMNEISLTGCLTFINLKLKNISVNANNSSCEDAVNFINVQGKLDKVIIANSFSDGLDVDFSNLSINEINIKSSQNDCVDFSAGNYKLKTLTLSNCGDKGISIGEKSFVKIEKINVYESKIGVASKDSSIFEGEILNLNNLNTCVAAYKKKQEFNGGFISINEMICKNYINKFEIDSFSRILEK